MTKNELQNYYDINSLCFDAYDQMCLQSYFYERQSVTWNKHWKRVKNALKKYKCKLVHYGDFSCFLGSYWPAMNKIKIMPPLVFVTIEDDNDLFGIFHYYKTLWHEIFHCAMYHEFHLGMFLKNEAEEMIIEEAIRDIVVQDIYDDLKFYVFSNDDRNLLEYFQSECNKYIEDYKKNCWYSKEDLKQFNVYKRRIINKLKSVYEECRPA